MINKEQFEQMYYSGKTLKEIAEITGISLDKSKSLVKKFGVTTRKAGRRRVELTGKRFGKLSVIRYIEEEQTYECVCDCGSFVSRDSSSLTTNESSEKMCWVCRNQYISQIKWKGCGEISMDKWIAIKRSAEVRGIIFDVSIEEMWSLFLHQGRKCALTNMPISFTHKKQDRALTTASLDRIDSSRGYTVDNVQWVHKDLNSMKSDFSQDKFIEYCRLVVNKFTTNP